jgi:hypothetical protein
MVVMVATVARADRVPGEWLDDNQEYGEAIEVMPGFYSSGTADDELVLVIPTKASHGTIDIEKILSRCLEFLRDGDVDQAVSVQYSVYRPHTLKSDAIDEIEAAQKELAKIEKETQLRRDIEKALAALRGAK